MIIGFWIWDDTIRYYFKKAALRLYSPQRPEDIQNAERTLSFHFPTFSESSFSSVSNSSPTMPMSPFDSIGNCQAVLEQSTSPYAHTFVISHLKILITSHFSLLSLHQKTEISSWFFFVSTHIAF